MEAQRFLQTPFWAEFKACHGWKALYFQIDADGSILPGNSEEKNRQTQDISSSKNQYTSDCLDKNRQEKKLSSTAVQKPILPQTDSSFHTVSILTVLVRSFSIKLRSFSIAYIPMAPEAPADTASPDGTAAYRTRLQQLAAMLKPYLPDNTICVRFDPPVDFSSCEERDAFAEALPHRSKSKSEAMPPLIHAPVAVQPPDTVLLPLAPEETELLSAMKSKWRYNIRLAEKKGVTVQAWHAADNGFEEAFDHFYELFQTTSERDGVSFHAKSYYRNLLERGTPDPSIPDKPLITLYLARHEQDYLAGIITLFCRREAVYLYGASGNVKRNFMPAYLLQWTAIKDAKQFGSPVYDFYGMPPTDDPNHPMHGLYLFKTGFGGQIVHRPGSFDVPLRISDYRLYIAAERLRAWWHRKVLKKIRGR